MKMVWKRKIKKGRSKQSLF